MNELQHAAVAALAVLNRVQIGLERIRTGHGSAAVPQCRSAAVPHCCQRSQTSYVMP